MRGPSCRGGPDFLCMTTYLRASTNAAYLGPQPPGDVLHHVLCEYSRAGPGGVGGRGQGGCCKTFWRVHRDKAAYFLACASGQSGLCFIGGTTSQQRRNPRDERAHQQLRPITCENVSPRHIHTHTHSAWDYRKKNLANAPIGRHTPHTHTPRPASRVWFAAGLAAERSARSTCVAASVRPDSRVGRSGARALSPWRARRTRLGSIS